MIETTFHCYNVSQILGNDRTDAEEILTEKKIWFLVSNIEENFLQTNWSS